MNREIQGILRVFAIASVVLASFIGIPRASASNFQGTDPEPFLNQDGTLSLPENYTGNLDLTGWEVELSPWAGPIFSPHNLNEGEWAALSSNGAGGGSIAANVNVVAVMGGDLYVGGSFIDVNNNGTILTAADRIVKWDGTNWSAVGVGSAGNGSIANGQVLALAVIGTDLYVGGSFTNVINSGTTLTAADRVAKWDGTNWSALGVGIGVNGSIANGQINALTVIGTDLYIAGTFINVINSGTTLTAADRVAKWDGSNWSALGVGLGVDGSINNGTAFALTAISGNLFVGGSFIDMVNSGTTLSAADRIAMWDGANWSALGVGSAGNGSIANGQVRALAAMGTDLFVGGTFINVINSGTTLTAADRVAKWDGSNWSALGIGTGVNGSIANGTVFGLTVVGGNLYVGGSFINVVNSGTTLTSADRVAKWNGSSWSALGSNGAGNGSLLNGQVNGLVELSGHLYVGGTFTDVNNGGTSLTAADRIAQLGVGSPAYASSPSVGSTLNIDGITGTSPSVDISVSNAGDTGTQLDVSLTSISAGYSVSGLPIADLGTSDPAVTITVDCDSVPQANGTLVLATNDPNNASVAYDLTCVAIDPAYSGSPAEGSTLALTGIAGTGPSPSENILVTNVGDAGSQLSVAFVSISGGYSVKGLPINDLGTTDPAENILVECSKVPHAKGTLTLATNDPVNSVVTYLLTCESTRDDESSMKISASGTTKFCFGWICVFVPEGAIPANETNCQIIIVDAGKSGEYGFTLDEKIYDVKIVCDSGSIILFVEPITVCIRPRDGVVSDKLVFHRHSGAANFTPLPLGSGPFGYVCGETQVLSLFALAGVNLPATGFAQGMVTELGEPETAYVVYDELTLEIPSLDLRIPILGVPQTQNGWDVSWLGQSAGYLNGTAFPTWVGNSVLTAHVWNADNTPGPFFHLKDLQSGDQFLIQAFGQTYVYEIRSNRLVSETNLGVMNDSDYSLVTLITCESYNEGSGEYLYRRVVQAVLIEVK